MEVKGSQKVAEELSVAELHQRQPSRDAINSVFYISSKLHSRYNSRYITQLLRKVFSNNQFPSLT